VSIEDLWNSIVLFLHNPDKLKPKMINHESKKRSPENFRVFQLSCFRDKKSFDKMQSNNN